MCIAIGWTINPEFMISGILFTGTEISIIGDVCVSENSGQIFGKWDGSPAVRPRKLTALNEMNPTIVLRSPVEYLIMHNQQTDFLPKPSFFTSEID